MTAARLPASIFAICVMISSAVSAAPASDRVLSVPLSNGVLTLTWYSPHALEVVWSPVDGPANPPGQIMAIEPRPAGVEILDAGDTLSAKSDGLSVEIQRQPARLKFFYQGAPLIETAEGEPAAGAGVHFGFHLGAEEKLFGAGSRALGRMNRRGERLDLYNSASYGYEDHARLMYYSMPAVVSSRKYMLAFDNAARGALDLDSRGEQRLDFTAVGGRRAYVLVAGATWPDLAAHLADATGHQPMLPRWAMGQFASRMGYHSQGEVESVVAGYRNAGFPLDAIILDMFWFGSSIFGHMGNLDWDRIAFPDPLTMLERLRTQGVHTVLITEPLVLKESKNWDSAVQNRALATRADGTPYTFASFFGEAALVDVFHPAARAWFWDFYRRHTQSGVAGWWGDLGEPETHPDDIQHYNGRGDHVHNLYGHTWAGLLYEGFRRDFPERRPFILMRSGFVGTQRYGILPWSGDVKRSWGGLKSQVELSLQMGLLGVAYMHSDLGGFAGDLRDPELYLRWMQYGVFQPLYRPHGHELVPAEPIFWDEDTQRRVRRQVEWRYRLLPYNYTLMFENATRGLPLMRPLMYLDDRAGMQDHLDDFLWGDAFLVAPITEPGLTERRVTLPRASAWYDVETDQLFEGGQTIAVPVTLERLPVFVRAGSFVPMIETLAHTDQYDGRQFWLHFYADPSGRSSSGHLYDDDGQSFDSYAHGQFEHIQFHAGQRPDGALQIRLSGERHPYPGRPDQRLFRLVVHGLDQPPATAQADGRDIDDMNWDAKRHLLTLPVLWSGEPRTVTLFRLPASGNSAEK